MSRLETQRISRASAEQRQGRAGRDRAGRVLSRLGRGRARRARAFTAPRDPGGGSRAAGTRARQLGSARGSGSCAGSMRRRRRCSRARATCCTARRAGCRGQHQRATGASMARLAVHPRLAHMLLRARALGSLSLAAQLAALLSERDLLRGSAAGAQDADVRTRLEMLRGERRRLRGPTRHRCSARGAWRASSSGSCPQRARLPATPMRADTSEADPGCCSHSPIPTASAAGDPAGRDATPSPTAAARPSRAHRGSRGSEFIVAVDLDDRERDARILLAAPLERSELLEHFAERLRRRECVEWRLARAGRAARGARSSSMRCVLEEKPLAADSRGRRRALRCSRACASSASQRCPGSARRASCRRASSSCAQGSSAAPACNWPEVGDAALAQSLERWLAPWLEGVTRREHLGARATRRCTARAADLRAAARAREWAPTHLTLPGGARVRVDYLGEQRPRCRCGCRRCSGSPPRRASGAAACPSLSGCSRLPSARCR